jgi:hypothetical protein
MGNRQAIRRKRQMKERRRREVNEATMMDKDTVQVLEMHLDAKMNILAKTVRPSRPSQSIARYSSVTEPFRFLRASSIYSFDLYTKKKHQSLAIFVLSAGCFSSIRGRGLLHVLPFFINTLLQSVGSKGACSHLLPLLPFTVALFSPPIPLAAATFSPLSAPKLLGIAWLNSFALTSRSASVSDFMRSASLEVGVLS